MIKLFKPAFFKTLVQLLRKALSSENNEDKTYVRKNRETKKKSGNMRKNYARE